ncbi:MAG: DUF2786 domain-containing protein [Bacteriovoracaceae bacterium]|nr:DUF2786 domain-containing protein [Bacteriovoracaceae bacterium]
MSKDILITEMGLVLKKSRVHHNGHSYPLKYVIFEDPKKIGYFDQHSFQIGINKSLMLNAKPAVIKNILRHELVHFFQFVTQGNTISPHGAEFKSLCRGFGYGADVSNATAQLEILNDQIEGDLYTEKLIVKIKKLLNLAESDNIHEREQATLKANQLLLKHNLKQYQVNSLQDGLEQTEEICLKRVLETKRTTSKMHAIYEILSCFFVQPVFNHGKGIVYLEVIGSRINVELAAYVTQFLEQELEFIWELTKKENSLKGVKARNSFFKGVGKGYASKIHQQNNQTLKDNELIVLKEELQNQVAKVYGRLSFSGSTAKTCDDSMLLGKKAGKSLNIRKGISSTSFSNKFLPFYGK